MHAQERRCSYTCNLFGHNPLITEMAAFFAADETEVLPKTGIYCACVRGRTLV
ncbi:MAG: hypothetical protein MZV63_18800 [Marinilabiliales bacterium]|nr:hypothetical protein [Marinilabiliales bacterium]